MTSAVARASTDRGVTCMKQALAHTSWASRSPGLKLTEFNTGFGFDRPSGLGTSTSIGPNGKFESFPKCRLDELPPSWLHRHGIGGLLTRRHEVGEEAKEASVRTRAGHLNKGCRGLRA